MNAKLNLTRADLQLLVSALVSHAVSIEETCESLENMKLDIDNEVQRLLAARALRRRIVAELERTAPAISWTEVEA